MTHRSTVYALVLSSLASCGGQTSIQGPSTSEAGAQDAQTEEAGSDATAVEDASGKPDASLEDSSIDASSEFCSGASKVSLPNGAVVEVPVTTGLVAMDCCDAFSLRFHADSFAASDVGVLFQTFGQMQAGQFALEAEAEGYQASAYTISGGEWGGGAMQGTIELASVGDNDGWRVDLCGQVDDADSPLDGTRLYASDIMVAWWGWDHRFQLRLLSDPTLTATDVSSVPVEELELGVNVLSLGQIAVYDWSEHVITLQEPWSNAAILYSQLPQVPVHGLPFVLTIDEAPVYLGAFTTLVSSVMVPLPSISVDDTAADRVTILPAPVGSVDVRDDARVEALMQEAGKLVP